MNYFTFMNNYCGITKLLSIFLVEFMSKIWAYLNHFLKGSLLGWHNSTLKIAKAFCLRV